MLSTISPMGQYELDRDSLELLGSASPQDNADVALGLAQGGFVVFPICNWANDGEWKPIKDFPAKASKDVAQIRKWWKQWPDARIGLLTGSRNGITVLDVDVKNGKDGRDALSAIGFSDLSAITPFRVRTPSGGWHLIFKYCEGVKNTVGKIGTGLDVRNENAFIVAPGSYKGGRQYVVVGEPIFRGSALPAIPEAILALAPSHDDFDDLLGGAVAIRKATEWQREWAAGKLHDQAAAVASAQEGQRQATLNNAVLMSAGYAVHGALDAKQVNETLCPAGIACGLSTREVASTFKHAWAAGLKKPLALPSDCEDEFEDLDPGEPLPARASDASRVGRLMRTEGGKLIVNATNAIAVLAREVDSILPDLRHNLMNARDEWANGAIDDASVMLARVHLERRGLPTIGKELVSDALAAVAKNRRFHPIRDWLKRLNHDGASRLDTWLSHYMGAEESAYSRAIGRAFLLSMVARVMQPGCKADHVLVLTGPQGIGKSSACRIMAGDEYFSDSLPAITNDKREAVMHLAGKWLVEMGELAPARRSDAEDLKAFISGAVDKVRLPYARRDQMFERQCVFIGTTNEDEFLNDATGGRRFWPVSLAGQIDLASLAKDREQLFAEAMLAYDAGEQWWLQRDFEREHAEPVRKLAEVTDPWEDPILAYLAGGEDDLGSGRAQRNEVRVVDVLLGAIGLQEAQHGTAQCKRVTNILKREGFARHHTRNGKVWRRDL